MQLHAIFSQHFASFLTLSLRFSANSHKSVTIFLANFEMYVKKKGVGGGLEKFKKYILSIKDELRLK